MMHQLLSKLLSAGRASMLSKERRDTFDKIIGYEGIKRTFLRSLNSKEPVHILLVGPPGQAKTLFLIDYSKRCTKQSCYRSTSGYSPWKSKDFRL